MPFWSLQFLLKKGTKRHGILVKRNSFVRFLEKFMAWKFAFEINWPLICTSMRTLAWFYEFLFYFNLYTNFYWCIRWMTKEKKTCLQRGSNSRPLVYKTSALPLSYRGLLHTQAAKVLRIYCCYVVLHLCNCAVYRVYSRLEFEIREQFGH